MRASYKAVILAALDWNELYDGPGDPARYDGAQGCEVRTRLSQAIYDMIDDEVARGKRSRVAPPPDDVSLVPPDTIWSRYQ